MERRTIPLWRLAKLAPAGKRSSRRNAKVNASDDVCRINVARTALTAADHDRFFVRALAWLGPEQAEGALRTLKAKLPSAVLMELVMAAPQFPTWLARTIGKVAHG